MSRHSAGYLCPVAQMTLSIPKLVTRIPTAPGQFAQADRKRVLEASVMGRRKLYPQFSDRSCERFRALVGLISAASTL